MLVIGFNFLTGRFHTTPWGRNVNEAVPEWPPSPYRLIRALIDVWKRKRPDWPKERVEHILELLASSPPNFYLPPATVSSIKAYLDENAADNVSRKQLVYDGFVALKPEDWILMTWPEIDPDKSLKGDLNELLTLLNYFGRSESLVNSSIIEDGAEKWNSIPLATDLPQSGMERVQVAVPTSKPDYERERPKASRSEGPKEKVEWMEALQWRTEDTFKNTLSRPPAMKYVTYLRRSDCFETRPVSRLRQSARPVDAVLFSLESKVLPSIAASVIISDRVRRKLMGLHKRLMGNDPARVSPKFSGKGVAGKILQGHKHCYFLPLDFDNDGYLDHMLVRCRETFDDMELLALDRLESIWQEKGKPDIRCIPLQRGCAGEIAGTRKAKRFRNGTPFVPTHHYRKGRGDFAEWLRSEVRREARNHGLPEPVGVQPIAKLRTRAREYRWLEFRRTRKGEDRNLGFGFEIEFTEPVVGPFSLGREAHFGLGLFIPEDEQ